MNRPPRVKIVFPTGMLGAGYPMELVQRALDQGATAIAIDGGSTDSGPYYLGTGEPKAATAALERDLRGALVLGRAADVPVIIGSCGTSGCDIALDRVANIAIQIAREERLEFRLARIYSEQSPDDVLAWRRAGRLLPLEPILDVDDKTIASCAHIVGLMGHEPILRALDAGADVVLAGRATDTAMVAAVALRAGLAPGPSWHAAKTVECGALCTTNPRSGPVLVEIDRDGFTVESLDTHGECTPHTVAAHMCYENADPFRLREPSGVLDTSQAVYTDIGDGRVRVERSRFEPAAQPTIKLEGSALRGYQTISMAGIRDPEVVTSITEWSSALLDILARRVQDVLGLDAGAYETELRRYGVDAILGPAEPDRQRCHEVLAVLKVRAADQQTARAIVQVANPLMLHMPLPSMHHLPSFAFMTSPAEIDLGAHYEFVLNHVVAVDSEVDLFRTTIEDVPR